MDKRRENEKSADYNDDLDTDVTQKSTSEKLVLSSVNSKNEDRTKSNNGKRQVPQLSSDNQNVDDNAGETLSSFVEEEWDSSRPAYNPEFINFKTEPDRISVFKANTTVQTLPMLDELSPPRISNLERINILTEVSPSGVSMSSGSGGNDTMQPIDVNAAHNCSQCLDGEQPKKRDKADEIGKLITEIVRIFLTNKKEHCVQISLDLLHSRRGRSPRGGRRSRSTSPSSSVNDDERMRSPVVKRIPLIQNSGSLASSPSSVEFDPSFADRTPRKTPNALFSFSSSISQNSSPSAEGLAFASTNNNEINRRQSVDYPAQRLRTGDEKARLNAENEPRK